jgi:hypothetical protein
VVVLRAAPIPRINVLLRILMGEVAILVQLSQMLGVRLAGMSLHHVETTGISRIPICKPFHDVQVWGGLDLLCLGWRRIISSDCGRRYSHVPWFPLRCKQCDGGCTSCIKCGWAAATIAATSSALSTAATVVGASKSVGGNWGRRWRWIVSLSSDAASSIALIE